MSKFGSKFRIWTKLLIVWLWKARAGFALVMVLVGAFCLDYFVYRTESSLIKIGGVLQILGLCVTIGSLMSLRRYFGQPGLLALVVSWIKDFPKWNRPVSAISGSSEIRFSANAQATVWSNDDPGLPVEERIERIVKNLKRVQENANETTRSLNQLQDEHNAHKREITKKVEESQSEIRTELENLHTGDIIYSLIGLTWVAVGLIVSSFAPELHNWFH